LFVEIHHIIPQAEGGPDVEDNAAPLCASCHSAYGANPVKRRDIRDARDLWYEIVERQRSNPVLDVQSIAQAVASAMRSDLADLSRYLVETVAAAQASGKQAAELSFGTFDTSDGEYFNRLTRAVETAQRVRIVTYATGRIATTRFTPTDAYFKARRRYLDTLVQRAADGMTYERIVTSDAISNKTSDISFLRPDARDHCRLMLELARTHPVALRRAPAELLADIVIIDDDTGGFSTEVVSPIRGTHTVGALIAHEPPDQQILNRLRVWWRELLDISSPIRQSEL
jgi:hypothetical protein